MKDTFIVMLVQTSCKVMQFSTHPNVTYVGGSSDVSSSFAPHDSGIHSNSITCYCGQLDYSDDDKLILQHLLCEKWCFQEYVVLKCIIGLMELSCIFLVLLELLVAVNKQTSYIGYLASSFCLFVMKYNHWTAASLHCKATNF